MPNHSKFWIAATFALTTVFPAFSHADMSDEEYQAALKVAQKKVARQKSLNSQSANALSSSLIRTLFGRYYQVGDNWDVAAWTFDNTTARMTSDPACLGNQRAAVAASSTTKW